MTDEQRDLERQIPAAPPAYRAADIEFLKYPHATLREMRSEARLHHARGRFAELGFGAGHLALTHYADANDVLRSRESRAAKEADERPLLTFLSTDSDDPRKQSRPCCGTD